MHPAWKTSSPMLCPGQEGQHGLRSALTSDKWEKTTDDRPARKKHALQILAAALALAYIGKYTIHGWYGVIKLPISGLHKTTHNAILHSLAENGPSVFLDKKNSGRCWCVFFFSAPKMENYVQVKLEIKFPCQ